MTELKTLKDMGINHLEFCDIEGRKIYLTDVIKIPELKAEVVKWAKYENLCINLTKTFHTDQAEKSEAVRNWIKHFYNLTEEDLK